MKENGISKGMILSIYCLVGVMCCGFIFIPYIQEQIILYAEKILHRSFANPLQQILRQAIRISSSMVFIFVFLVPRIRSEKYDGLFKGLLIFIFMMSQLLVGMKLGTIYGGYIQTSYLLSYRYGFASRMFIGTIVDLLSGGGFVSKDFIITFIFYSLILFCFAIAVVFYFLLQKINGKTKLPVMVLFIIYLFSPISLLVYFTPDFFGRMEVYGLLCMLIIFSVIDKDKWCFLIPVLCFISIASHLVVVFFYIPAVLLILFYTLFSNQPPKWDTKYVLLITVLVITAAFLYFILFSKSALIFQTEDEFISFLKNKTDISLDHASIRYDYFLSIDKTLEYAMKIYTRDRIYSGFYAILQAMPLFLFFMLFWISCIKTEVRRFIKAIFLISALLPFLSIPAFILFVDWGRWLVMIFTTQFMLVFYFLYKQENSVIFTAQKMVTIIKDNYHVVIVLSFISLFFGCLGCMGSSRNFHFLLSLIVRVLKKLVVG